jgi:hypothetical protein
MLASAIQGVVGSAMTPCPLLVFSSRIVQLLTSNVQHAQVADQDAIQQPVSDMS